MERDLVRDGVCGQGHAIYGPGDTVRHADGVLRCVACLQEMTRERAALRQAEADRRRRAMPPPLTEDEVARGRVRAYRLAAELNRQRNRGRR